MLALMAAVSLAPSQPFTCTVTRVHDGDGPIWCAEGPKVRVAGVQAPDLKNTEPCKQRRTDYVCNDVRARASQRLVSSMVLHRQIRCAALEPSYERVVARCRLPDGRDLSCATIAASAAVRWDKYWRRYRMEACR